MKGGGREGERERVSVSFVCFHSLAVSLSLYSSLSSTWLALAVAPHSWTPPAPHRPEPPPPPPSPFPPVFIFLPKRMPDHLALIYFSRWEDLQKDEKGETATRSKLCHGDSPQRGVKLQRKAGLSIFEYIKSRRLKSGCPGTVMGRQQASGISPSTTAASDPPCSPHYQRINPHISGCRNGPRKCQPFNFGYTFPILSLFLH